MCFCGCLVLPSSGGIGEWLRERVIWCLCGVVRVRIPTGGALHLVEVSGGFQDHPSRRHWRLTAEISW